jgi:hypothetical protein
MVLAPDITRDELTELGEKFNQDSVIYSDHNKNEMIFTTGEHKGQRHVGNGFDLLPKEAGDYYTEIALLKKTIKFSLHFDFDRFVKSLFERLFSHIRPLKKSGEAACRKVGDKLGVDWKKVDFDEFCDGMFEEDEHGGNAEESAKIALDHLKEDPKYYSKLKAAGLAGKEK